MTQRERLSANGIRRLRRGRAFRYISSTGASVSRSDVQRIQAMRIPPAWRSVAIAHRAESRLQAVGQDAAGRWQYVYHAAHVRRREREKFTRVVHFGAALPRMRRTVAQHLRLPGLPKEKVLACILRILALSFIRPGSELYAAENGSYGIATLRRKHTKVRGDVLRLDFPGKSGQRQQIECRDRQVARIVRQLLALPGHEVFKFTNGDGQLVDIRRMHINEYIKDVMGEHFSAKDFRTWAGTLVCAVALARTGTCANESPTVRKHNVVAAVRETAEALGNTPAVCRSAYIFPRVLDSYHAGTVIQTRCASIDDLRRRPRASERALLRLLRKRGQLL